MNSLDCVFSYLSKNGIIFIPNEPALLVTTKRDKFLVVCDLHLHAPRLRDWNAIRNIIEQEINRILYLARKYNANNIIINGDLKEKIGKTSKTFAKILREYIEFLAKSVDSVTICKGNHDGTIEEILQETNVEIRNTFKIERILFLHGHQKIKPSEVNDINVVISAHIHPVAIIHGNHITKMKCWVISLTEINQKTLLWITEPAFSETWGFAISEITKDYLEKIAPIRSIKILKSFLLSLDLLLLKHFE